MACSGPLTRFEFNQPQFAGLTARCGFFFSSFSRSFEIAVRFIREHPESKIAISHSNRTRGPAHWRLVQFRALICHGSRTGKMVNPTPQRPFAFVFDR